MTIDSLELKIKLDEESVALLERLEKIGPNIAALKIVDCPRDTMLVFEYPGTISQEMVPKVTRVFEQRTRRRCLILQDGMTLAGVIRESPEDADCDPAGKLRGIKEFWEDEKLACPESHPYEPSDGLKTALHESLERLRDNEIESTS